ncbi:MAG TPA: DUF6468 domain-containing protein [Caulobacteraceae bacterium]|jgi:hypothetical protein
MIAIGLNLILGVLLFCALILGLRLERKLRGLRDSHADFAKAVGELDSAAGRTENSLQALRAGTETAKNEVASRIDQARIACQRLEKLTADADKAADRLAAQPLSLVNRAPPPPRAPQPAAPPPPAPSAIARPEPDHLRPAAPVQPQVRPAPEPLRAQSPRSRARMIDDDLFDLDPMVGVPAQSRAPAGRSPAESRLPETRPPERSNVSALRTERPLVERPANDRAAREALFREVLERDEATLRDPFEEGRFAHERRAMMAAVMGGRR